MAGIGALINRKTLITWRWMPRPAAQLFTHPASKPLVWGICVLASPSLRMKPMKN